MKNFLSLILLTCLFQNAISQTSRIAGKITDSFSGLPLTDIHIFIPNTTFQAFSDTAGNFLMTGIPEGKWEVQIRGLGWEHESRVIQVQAGIAKELTIQLKGNKSPKRIPAVLSKSKTSKFIEEVKFHFVGKDTDKISFLNPDKLFFEENPDKSYLVSSIGPLFFSNNQTGYLISVYFEAFTLGSEVSSQTTITYFELPKEENTENARRAARLAAYQSSPEFFLAQLLEGKTEGGMNSANPQVAFTNYPGDYELTFSKPLTLNLPNGSQGTLDYQGDKLFVKLNGAPLNPDQLKLGGVFADLNPLLGVPSNFNADRLSKLANLQKNEEVMQERLYLHTDRKHYWPAETIYFKAYLSFGNPLVAEELSKVLHLELIDTTEYVWIHRVFEIKDGVAQGHISLPDLAETGNFYLRAYTAWALNYEQGEVILPIQILSHQNQPESSPVQPKSEKISVFSNKQSYSGGEKVTLNLMALNQENKPLKANLSVSILDLNQAVYLPEETTLKNRFLPLKPIGGMESFEFEVEKGFRLEGSLLSEDGEPVQGSIKAFINGYDDVRSLKSEKDGKFLFPASNFIGDFEISMQATEQNSKPIRVIKLDLKSYPKQSDLTSFSFPKRVRRNTPPDPSIRPIRSLEAGEILLDEAVVNEKKESSIGPMIYGRPDKVVMTEGMNLAGTAIQFLYALSAQVAGLRIVGSPPNVSVSLRGGEPLVLVNGVPANGSSGTMLGGSEGRSVYDVLESINVFNIERVEVLRRLVPMYGDLGRNGVISIILKSGDQIQAGMNNFTLHKLQGFSIDVPFEKLEEQRMSWPFLAPFKPTLYWNPSIINDGSRLSIPVEFFLNEKSGPILVEVRGITDLGEPIYGTFLLNEMTN